jgi:outer membrane biosynthesis protein TonB
MPTSEVPPNVNEPNKQPEKSSAASQEPGGIEQESPVSGQDVHESAAPVVSGSRWIDYDTHELLEMISELEDERRWARLREGALWAILAHIAILLVLFLLPRYITVPPVVDRTSKLDKDEFTYMDSPQWKPKPPPKPLAEQPRIDRKTLDEMKRQTPPAPVAQQPQPQPPVQQSTPAPAPQPPPPQTSQQSQLEAPRPAAVPARPNFAMNSGNPADQLRDAMRGAAREHGSGDTGNLGADRLARHPGAGTGGVQVLSDTQGVDFKNWLQRWHWETEHTWDPLIPDEVNPPIYKSGMVAIRFKVLPNGRLMDGSLVLEGRSGDVALDRAAWGALTGSNYPPLPREFHGPYLELRAYFLYNMEPPK